MKQFLLDEQLGGNISVTRGFRVGGNKKEERTLTFTSRPAVTQSASGTWEPAENLQQGQLGQEAMKFHCSSSRR